MDITQFKKIHIDEVVQLSRRLESDSIPSSYWGLDATSAEGLLKNPNKISFVALLDQAVIGMATLSRGEFFQQHLAEVSVAVHPDHRQRGLARALVEQLEKSAQEAGIEMLKALITTTNTPSRRLFESLGYEHRATLYAEFKSAKFGEIDDCVYYKRISALSGAQPPIEPWI